jgi:hypothetical protein
MPASAPVHTHIHAVWTAGPTNDGVPAGVEAEAGPDGAVLDLANGVWHVQASAPGYWSQGADVVVSRQAPASVRLALWPAANLRIEIETARGEEPPQSLRVRLSSRPAAVGLPQVEQSLSNAELNCGIEGGEWSCLAPAGLFDARIEAESYAPSYAWGVRLKAAENTDLGKIELRRTLSVFGRAVRKDGSEPTGRCQAILTPDMLRGGGPEPQPDNPPPDEKTFTVSVNQQGYFQIAGVKPGRHLLTVECKQASGQRELQVQVEGETRVDPPLMLQELTLDIVITPKADPEGKPWQLIVDATTPRIRRIEGTATTGTDGRWSRHGLMAGSYRVIVSNSDGQQWLKKDFDLLPESEPLALHLASARVAGKVLLDDVPVRARLLFSNQAGGEPVTLNSDDRGHFTGVLPIADGAMESTWAVEAHVAHPETVRRLSDVEVPTVAAGAGAWLDLVLPTIPVRGTVVSQSGQPQNGAQVTFETEGGGYRTTLATDGAGTFEMADLLPGKYNAVAQSSFGISDPTEFAVAAGSESRPKLILRPYLHIPIYVISSDGDPIAGASVQVWSQPGVPRAFGHTDRNGRLVVNLPPGTTEVGLTVGAQGYEIELKNLAVSSTPVTSDSGQPPDQYTVTLSANGGTLALNFEPPEGTLDRSAALYLTHDGAIADARTLEGWGTDRAGSNSDGPAQIDSIEPGDYALCVVTAPSQLAALWEGSAPQESCSKGTVKADQTLTLSPKSQ